MDENLTYRNGGQVGTAVQPGINAHERLDAALREYKRRIAGVKEMVADRRSHETTAALELLLSGRFGRGLRSAVYHGGIQDYSSNEPTMDGTASAILTWMTAKMGPAK